MESSKHFIDAKVTKDSIKVAVADNKVTVTPADGAAGQSFIRFKSIKFSRYVCELNQLTLDTDKKLKLTVKNGKVDSEAGLKALKKLD
ncbi:hypothetical protein ACEW7V_03105 [Areca yellow leaf disease phytoplasma]|uniref:hypothetical protein n=1 Tax=Areca yellow leaf disease phytoplasma TaxID=927614 RepID=UPI0035B53632